MQTDKTETPETDAKQVSVRTALQRHGGGKRVILADDARSLERRLAEMTAKCDRLKKERDGAMHSGEEWELLHAKRHEELEAMTEQRDDLLETLANTADKLGYTEQVSKEIESRIGSTKVSDGIKAHVDSLLAAALQRAERAESERDEVNRAIQTLNGFDAFWKAAISLKPKIMQHETNPENTVAPWLNEKIQIHIHDSNIPKFEELQYEAGEWTAWDDGNPHGGLWIAGPSGNLIAVGCHADPEVDVKRAIWMAHVLNTAQGLRKLVCELGERLGMEGDTPEAIALELDNNKAEESACDDR